jgi:hypothetical protein
MDNIERLAAYLDPLMLTVEEAETLKNIHSLDPDEAERWLADMFVKYDLG